MKYILLILTLSFSLFANSIEWQKDYKTTLEKAQKEDKMLFVFIGSKNCKYCEKLKNTTLKNKKIITNINKKYASVFVMRDKDDYPSKLHTKATPMLYFLDKNENIIDYSLGYWDEVDFDFILKDVDKRYLKKAKK